MMMDVMALFSDLAASENLKSTDREKSGFYVYYIVHIVRLCPTCEVKLGIDQYGLSHFILDMGSILKKQIFRYFFSQKRLSSSDF